MSAGGQDMPGGKTRAQWQQQADEIERLTAELEDEKYRYGWLKSELHTNAKIIGEQQDTIERLRDVILSAPAPDMNECDQHIWWTVKGSAYKGWYDCSRQALAATEQGGE